MKTLALVDFETTGLDPQSDRIIELGVVLWSAEHFSVLECYSALLPAQSNPAARFNGIPEDLLQQASREVDLSWQVFLSICERADAVVAHQADFDRAFLREVIDYCDSDSPAADAFAEELTALHEKDWICTIEDMEWPCPTPYKHLIGVALAHGVAVVSAHRAIQDCLLLARCLERLPDVGYLERALARSRRPKAEFVSLAPFEENHVVKAAGFHFNGEHKKWFRRMAIEDAGKLPFNVEMVGS